MSKLARKPIAVPKGVEVKLNDSLVSVKGPKGTLQKTLPEGISISIQPDALMVLSRTNDRQARMLWGLTWSLVRNMIIGVTDGFEKVLEFQGVGYKATVKGSDLELGLGFSHPVVVAGPEGVTFKTDKNSIRIQGIDKELVGEIAAEIRKHRPPEPFKGSGIRYQNEIIRRKAGKKAAATS